MTSITDERWMVIIEMFYCKLVYLRSNDDSYRYEEEAKSGQHQKQVEKIIPCSF